MPITRPPIIQKPFAESGDKNTIPVASQVGIIDGAASFETGFPPDTMLDVGVGGIAPDGLDMNGILNIITQHIRFWIAGGYPRFDATLCTEIGGYPVGAVLQDNSGVNLYRNILANNTTDFNTTPASIGVSWIWLAGQTRSIVAGAGLIGGGVLATSYVTLNMGTPGTCSDSTSNAVTADSHTHAITSAPYATNATLADNAGYADNAGNADYLDGYHAASLINVQSNVGNIGTYYYYDTAEPSEYPPTKFGGLWEYCGRAGADGHYFKLYRRYQ